ncbi:MAG: hypothetical protein GY757_56015 [bacterium]|nr:hypothetical protein [bacterium]
MKVCGAVEVFLDGELVFKTGIVDSDIPEENTITKLAAYETVSFPPKELPKNPGKLSGAYKKRGPNGRARKNPMTI